MNVTCPNCATIYRVDPAKVPEAGVRARCAVCNAVFPVRREGETERTEAATPVIAAAAQPEAGAARAEPARSEPARAAAPRPEPPPPEPPKSPPIGSTPVPAAAARITEPEALAPSQGPVAPMPPTPTPSPATTPPRPVAPPRPANPFTRPAATPAGPTSNPAAAAPAPPARPAAPPATPSSPAAAPAAATSTRPPAAPVGGPPSTAARPAPRPANPFLSQDPALKARRLARALISDMVVYHPGKRQEGLRDGNLKELFEEEIKKSWEEYAEQVGREVAESTTYFREALNEILAGGRQIF